MRRAQILALGLIITSACGSASQAPSDADTTTTSEATGTTAADEGPGCVDEAPAEPTGCEGVTFPGDESPRTLGLELRGQLDPTFGFDSVLAFHNDASAVCGDTCGCHDVGFAVHFQVAPETGRVYRIDADLPAEAMHVQQFVGAQWTPEHDACTYMAASVEDPSSQGRVEILSAGDSCLAGVVSGFDGEFAAINGPFMAGRCE